MAKTRTYTAQQDAFLAALEGEANGNIREAMNIAGYSKNVRQSDIVNSLKDEILEIAKTKLAGGSIKAVDELLNLLSNPQSLSARTTIAAVREILDRTGIVKQEQVTVSTDGGGVFILPPKRPVDEDDY